MFGRKCEPQLPSSVSADDIPNSFASFMHNKIANTRREHDSRSGHVTHYPFHVVPLTSLAPVSEDVIQKLISRVPLPYYLSSTRKAYCTQKAYVILPKVPVAGYSQTHMHPTYVASDKVTLQTGAVSRGTCHVTTKQRFVTTSMD